MFEENFLILQVRKEDINLPCAWIRVPSRRNDVNKGPIKITYNGKHCYLQCKTVDDTLDNHKSYAIIKHCYPNENIIFISEHYRDILGIDKPKVTTSKNIFKELKYRKCKLSIHYPNRISKYIYFYEAAWQHPDIYAKISITIGVLSLFLGIFGLILGLLSIDHIKNSLLIKNYTLKGAYLFILISSACYFLYHTIFKKKIECFWKVSLSIVLIIFSFILYILQCS